MFAKNLKRKPRYNLHKYGNIYTIAKIYIVISFVVKMFIEIVYRVLSFNEIKATSVEARGNREIYFSLIDFAALIVFAIKRELKTSFTFSFFQIPTQSYFDLAQSEKS
jgi:hypothetical protein